MENKIVLIFSGYNPRAVIAFLRTLNSLKMPYAIIAKKDNDNIYFTSFKTKVMAKRTFQKLDFNDIQNCITQIKKKTGFKEAIIAPSTEALNRFLLDYKKEFEANDCYIPLVEKKLYEKISDKIRFSNLCNKYNIKIPNYTEDFEQTTPPFVAKPKFYLASNNKIYTPIIVENLIQKREFYSKYPISDFYYQSFITGQSYYFLYYISKQQKIYKYSQKNLIQQSGGKSIVFALSSNIHDSSESQKYETMLLKEGFFGLIMVEVKKQKDEFIMIEANPRFWGPSQLFVDAGVNLFIPFLKDNSFEVDTQIQNPEKVECFYLWFGGILKELKKNKQLTFHTNSALSYLSNLNNYINKDVYLRNDSNNWFIKELCDE